jgi:hypothetical protein
MVKQKIGGLLRLPIFYGNAPYTSATILNLNVNVGGFGQEAYFNNGADARQLWVKVNDTVAFVIAFGDVPKEEGAKATAQLLIAAIK